MILQGSSRAHIKAFAWARSDPLASVRNGSARSFRSPTRTPRSRISTSDRRTMSTRRDRGRPHRGSPFQQGGPSPPHGSTHDRFRRMAESGLSGKVGSGAGWPPCDWVGWVSDRLLSVRKPKIKTRLIASRWGISIPIELLQSITCLDQSHAYCPKMPTGRRSQSSMAADSL